MPGRFKALTFLALVFCLVFPAAASTAANASDGVAEDVRDAFVDCGLLTEEGTPARAVHPGICMRPWVDSLYAAYGIAPVLEEFATLYQEENITAYHCHSMFHQLGGEVVLGEGEQLLLGPLWTLCGSGFLHGLFERMPLPDDPDTAGRRAMEACTNQEFASQTYIYFDCVHSNGHAIHAAFPDLKVGEQACVAGSLAGAGHRAEVLRDQCLNGLYMSFSERTVDPDNPSVPTDEQGWAERFGYCAETLNPKECAVNYSRFAVRELGSVESYLDWCLGLAEGDTLCLKRLGMDLGTLSIVTGRSEYSNLCAELAEARSLPDDDCRSGLVSAATEAGEPGALAGACGGGACTAGGPTLFIVVAALAGLGVVPVGVLLLRRRSRRRGPQDGVHTP